MRALWIVSLLLVLFTGSAAAQAASIEVRPAEVTLHADRGQIQRGLLLRTSSDIDGW